MLRHTMLHRLGSFSTLYSCLVEVKKPPQHPPHPVLHQQGLSLINEIITWKVFLPGVHIVALNNLMGRSGGDEGSSGPKTVQ